MNFKAYTRGFWGICIFIRINLKQSVFYVKLKSNCIVSIIKPTRCTNWSNYFILKCHSTCFGRSFRPSLGVQDCTYSNRHLSNRHCCLLRQQCLFDKCLLLYAQSWTPDDGRKDRPKHVEWHFKIIWYITAASWFYYRNKLRCTALWTSNLNCISFLKNCSYAK